MARENLDDFAPSATKRGGVFIGRTVVGIENRYYPPADHYRRGRAHVIAGELRKRRALRMHFAVAP